MSSGTYEEIERLVQLRREGKLAPDQRSTRDQLRDLRRYANALGLYDAADHLSQVFNLGWNE